MPVRYAIDREDRISEVNHEWSTFANENRGQALLPPSILAKPLWGFLADGTTIELYQSMVARLRKGGSPIRFQFRCDAPDRRRLLAMEISGSESGAVVFCVTPVAEQSRAAVALLVSAGPRTDGLLTICGWCKRVPLRAKVWAEVEEAVQSFGLFQGGPMPALTHGICPTCYATMMGALDDPVLAASGTVTVGALQSV